MLILLEIFPRFALIYLVATLNFDDSSLPILSRRWLVIAYILNALFIILFVAIFFNLIGSYLNVSDKDVESIRNLRVHYFGAFSITGILIRLKGKYVTKGGNSV